MLENDSEKTPKERPGAKALLVQGALFTNTAAKFWSSLIDEVHFDYPDCDAIVLDTLTDALLSKELLFPEAALQRDLDKYAYPPWRIRQALREAIEEFELIGPPDVVRIRLFSGEVETKKCELPVDCVDADIFPCLLVWLLEWSGIPEWLWNDPTVQGDFLAKDHARSVHYHLRVELSNAHVSEGLFQRILKIHFTRRKD